jgi:hypothetical protein
MAVITAGLNTYEQGRVRVGVDPKARKVVILTRTQMGGEVSDVALAGYEASVLLLDLQAAVADLRLRLGAS